MSGAPWGADSVAIAQPDSGGNSLCQCHPIPHRHPKPHGNVKCYSNSEPEHDPHTDSKRNAQPNADSHTDAIGNCNRESHGHALCGQHGNGIAHIDADPDQHGGTTIARHRYGLSNSYRQLRADADRQSNFHRHSVRNHATNGNADPDQHANAIVDSRCH